MIELVQAKVHDIERQRDTVVGKLDHLLDLIRTLEDKVKTTRSEVVAKTSGDISVLNQYKSSLSEWINSQASLGELAQYLVEKASDAEVVTMATDLPSPTSMSAHDSPPILKIPQVSSKFLVLEEIVQSMETHRLCKLTRMNLKVRGTKEVLPDTRVKPTVTPIERLKPEKSIRANNVRDVTFNPAKSQFVVKTSDSTDPIKVYDLKGNKRAQFGGSIVGLSGDGRLSIDSHRDLYLAACDGHLTTVTMYGHRNDRIDMKGCDLRGVAYIKQNDLYVVSDVTKHKISLIDPRTKSIVRSFGSKGTRPGQFDIPISITTYTDQGNPIIVVSDFNNHRVQLLDLYGTPLDTFGNMGRGDAKLGQPG